nr:small integral membrane protein 31-like [Nerophis lumbriciformis]
MKLQINNIHTLTAASFALVSMELPFSGFELTFIVAAFVIFTLFSLASVCIKPDGSLLEKRGYKAGKWKQRVISRQAAAEA